MLYFVTYLFSALCAEVGVRSKHRLLGVFLMVIALLVPAMLAGFRDVSIGVDRLVYGDDLFRDVACSQDFLHMESRWQGWIEGGYIWLNFFVSRFSSDVAFFYFIHALIISLCVLVSLKNLCIEKYAGFTYGMFLFLFFQPSFNSIRQSLAAAIVLLSMSFFLTKRKIPSIICFLLAYSMHHSALLSLSFLGIVFFIQKNLSLKKFLVIDLIFFFVLISGGALINNFAPYLNIEIGRYDKYFAHSSKSMATFNKSLFLLNILLCVPIIKNWKELVNKNKYYALLVVSSLGLVLFSQLGFFGGEFIGRVATYYYWMLLLLVPLILNYGKQKKLSFAIFSGYTVFYWWLYFIYYGFNQTYPYKSQILGL